MSRKEKETKKHKNSTRELMGITEITDYSLITPYGELVYFIIHQQIFLHFRKVV